MSRTMIRSFNAYAIGLAAIALLLAIPSTARAGYPDGLNTYAGYHIMQGGVDPQGTFQIMSVAPGPVVSFSRSKGLDKVALLWWSTAIYPEPGDMQWVKANGGATFVHERTIRYEIEICTTGETWKGELTNWYVDPISADGVNPFDEEELAGEVAYMPIIDFTSIRFIKSKTGGQGKGESYGDYATRIACGTRGHIALHVRTNMVLGNHRDFRGDFNKKGQESAVNHGGLGYPWQVHNYWTDTYPNNARHDVGPMFSIDADFTWDACSENKSLNFFTTTDSIPTGPGRRNPSWEGGYDPAPGGGWKPRPPKPLPAR